MIPARREHLSAVIARALSGLFRALSVEVGEETAEAHVEAALRAMGQEQDAGVVSAVIAEAVAAIVDAWEPTAWQRVPVPAQVRRAIFDARRARAKTVQAQRALPERSMDREQVKRLIDELAEKLGWGKDWRDDATRRASERERIDRRVKELLEEEEGRQRRKEGRHRARRPRARG